MESQTAALEKACRVCKALKPATQEHFHRNPRLRDGLFSECKACVEERRRARRQGNPEKTAAEQRRYRTTEIYRLKHAASEAARRAKDRDAFLEYRRAYYSRTLKSERILLTDQERRGRAQEACRKHWLANRQTYRTKTLNYIARKRDAAGTHTAQDIEEIIKRQIYRCYWCDADLSEGMQVDHYIPLSRGGTNWPDNLVASCPICNKAKGAKMPEAFRAYLERRMSHGVPAIAPPVIMPE